MRRTKEWWSRLTKDERGRLVWIERVAQHGGTGYAYLPEGYGMCPMCSTPNRGGTLCGACYDEWRALIRKGDGKE